MNTPITLAEMIKKSREMNIKEHKGKTSYTEDEAKNMSQELSKNSKASFVHYKCSYCGSFHIGHSKLPELYKRKPIKPKTEAQTVKELGRY